MSCTSGVDWLLFAVAALSLRCALRVLAIGGSAALRACRRWGSLATATAAFGYFLQSAVAIEPVMLLMVSIAALDCWLVSVGAPRPNLPRAVVRRRASLGIWGWR